MARAAVLDGDPDAVRVAERLGVGHLLDRVIGEDAAGLSAGETRRLGVARALARPTPLLLLDEPTAHLDTGSAAAVAELLDELPSGRTVLLATHDPLLLRGVDRVLRLANGRIREHDPEVTP